MYEAPLICLMNFILLRHTSDPSLLVGSHLLASYHPLFASQAQATHFHTHSHALTCTPPHTCIHTPTHLHTYSRALTCTLPRTCIRTFTHLHAHLCTPQAHPTHLHTHSHALAFTLPRTYMHTPAYPRYNRSARDTPPKNRGRSHPHHMVKGQLQRGDRDWTECVECSAHHLH